MKILTAIRNRVQRWLDNLVQRAIRDGVEVYLYRPEARAEPGYQLRPTRTRRPIVISDQAQLWIGRAYITLTSGVAISAGILGWPIVGFVIWLWGLVIPLVALLIWRRRLER